MRVLHQELADAATRKLAEALLAQEQVQARKRWALLQLSLWQERGLVQPLVAAGQYGLTSSGRRQLCRRAFFFGHEARGIERSG